MGSFSPNLIWEGTTQAFDSVSDHFPCKYQWELSFQKYYRAFAHVHLMYCSQGLLVLLIPPYYQTWSRARYLLMFEFGEKGLR